MKDRISRYLLPGIIFQSVLIGGAYATGREIVEYGGKFGVMGIWSILALGAGFSLMAIVSYEFARVFQLYDYRSFAKALIGRFWILFDLLFITMSVVVIAVVGSASGSIVNTILGLPYWLGVVFVIVLVGFLNALGRNAIIRFKTVGSVVLYAGYLIFTGVVLSQKWPAVKAVFARQDTSYFGDVSIGPAIFAGILYVGYNLSAQPATFFSLDVQTRRRHAVWAGIITGLLATIPFVLTYLAIMGFYPEEAVLGADVPWLVMLERTAGPWMAWIYAIVILWTLIETSTGLIHAIIRRIEAGRHEAYLGELSKSQIVTITIAILLAAALLSRFGLIALVAQGYTYMAYGFLLIFALPLLTIGLVRIFAAKIPTRQVEDSS